MSEGFRPVGFCFWSFDPDGWTRVYPNLLWGLWRILASVRITPAAGAPGNGVYYSVDRGYWYTLQ